MLEKPVLILTFPLLMTFLMQIVPDSQTKLFETFGSAAFAIWIIYMLIQLLKVVKTFKDPVKPIPLSLDLASIVSSIQTQNQISSQLKEIILDIHHDVDESKKILNIVDKSLDIAMERQVTIDEIRTIIKEVGQ